MSARKSDVWVFEEGARWRVLGTRPDGELVVTSIDKGGKTITLNRVNETRDVTSPLLKALNGIPGVHFTRINSGGYRGRMKGAPAGTPDLLGTVNGKAAAIETKAPGGKLSPAQRDWYTRNGHLYLYGVPCSVADGIELVKGWMR